MDIINLFSDYLHWSVYHFKQQSILVAPYKETYYLTGYVKEESNDDILFISIGWKP